MTITAMGRVFRVEEENMMGRFDIDDSKDVEFVQEVDRAYKILSEMYRPEDGDGCDYDSDKEAALLEMTNCIDRVMGR